MKISVVSGSHLTAQNKTAIKAILAAELIEGKVGRTSYWLESLGDGNYKVVAQSKQRGIGLGAPLRMCTYKTNIKVKL